MIDWIKSKQVILTFVTASAGLLTAVAGLINSVKEPGAAKAYETLRVAVVASQEAEQKNHDDLVRVTAWIDDLRKADEANRVMALRGLCPQYGSTQGSGSTAGPVASSLPVPVASAFIGPRPMASAAPSMASSLPSGLPSVKGYEPPSLVFQTVPPALSAKPKAVPLPKNFDSL